MFQLRLVSLNIAIAVSEVALTARSEAPPAAAPVLGAQRFAPPPPAVTSDDYFVTEPLGPVNAWTPSALPVMVLPPLSPLERRSSLAMVSGIVLTSVGGLALTLVAAGEVFGDRPSNEETALGTVTGDERDPSARGFLIGGLVCVAVGIPLIVYGAKRVRVRSTVAFVPFSPSWVGVPTSRGWGWHF